MLAIARFIAIVPPGNTLETTSFRGTRNKARVLLLRSVFDNYELDEFWMRQALAQADTAAKAGDVPIGAIVVSAKNELLASGFNRRELDGDPTAHAEIIALREAAVRRGHWRLDGTTLYSTLEPCAMCAGALVNARVSRVVYGASDPKAGAVASVYSIGVDGRLNHRLRYSDGVLVEECLQRLQRFFEGLRAEGQK